MFFRTNLVILTRSSVKTFLLVRLLRAFSRALSPASRGILGYYNSTAFAVTKIKSLGIVLIFLIFLMKSSESFIYDLLLCIIDFNWLSKNFATFSVGVSQFEITGLPGTFSKRLWILGSKYNRLNLRPL